MALEHTNARVRAHALGEHALNLAARDVAGVDDAACAVASFPREVEGAVRIETVHLRESCAELHEGIDARVAVILKKEVGAANYADISIGDYVLTGGELPAMILIDTISRQIEGVLGKYESLEEERISASEFYTRPEILEWKGKKHKVPPVLLGGNHKEIEKWKESKKK